MSDGGICKQWAQLCLGEPVNTPNNSVDYTQQKEGSDYVCGGGDIKKNKKGGEFLSCKKNS